MIIISPINPAYCLQARSDHPASILRNALSVAAAGAMAQGATSVGGGVHAALGNRLNTIGQTGMTVQVDTGLVYMPGSIAWQGPYVGYNTGLYTVTIPAASSTQWRSDYIVAVQNDSTYGGTVYGANGADGWDIVCIEGAFSSSSPGVLPSLPNNSVPLAIIRVVPNMTVTNGAGTVVDARKYVALSGPIYTTSSAKPPTTAPGGTLWVETDTHQLGIILNGARQYIVSTSDVWHNLNTWAAGWSVSGYAKYKFADATQTVVRVAFRNLVPGTTTDSTTVLAAANGFPSAYRPVTFKRFPVVADILRLSAGGPNNEGPALEVGPDGSIQCFGIGLTASRVDAYVDMPIDI